ncbi:MAG: hypothetical protein CM15mP12_7980 [Gammaproteobacteria bacterium]|nr:MAG: hypothetical protein CM15mP12_7980 [Gammaproteobacteria bacterium]
MKYGQTSYPSLEYVLLDIPHLIVLKHFHSQLPKKYNSIQTRILESNKKKLELTGTEYLNFRTALMQEYERGLY